MILTESTLEKLSMASHKVYEYSKQTEKTGIHIRMKAISLTEHLTATA